MHRAVILAADLLKAAAELPRKISRTLSGKRRAKAKVAKRSRKINR